MSEKQNNQVKITSGIRLNPATIVFFVSGYAADERALKELTQNIHNDAPGKYVFGPAINLNATMCPENKKDILAFLTPSAQNYAQAAMERLEALVRSHPGRYILVRPRLCGKYVDAPIELQAARLTYLIHFLKTELHSDARIVLIGHSQGGVVNLEVAARLKNMVNHVISINSPYAEVQPIKDVFTMLKFVRLGNEPFFHYFHRIIGEDLKEEQVNNLIKTAKLYTTPTYIEKIKRRFFALKKRPRLSLVVSACGVYNDSLLGWRRAYDGFIPLEEQLSIAYDDMVFLRPKPLPCERNNPMTSNVFDRCLTCHECNMPELKGRYFIRALIQKESPQSLINAMLDGGFDAIENREIDSRYQESVIYKILYDTYASPYSHHRIAHNPETALVIRRWLENCR